MATSYEKRHLVDLAWYHKRPSGGGGTSAPATDFILLEDDPGTETELILLEDDPGTGTDAIELQG